MSNWTIFSNHGHVLVCLARDSEARLRDVALDVGITERAVQKIVRDLQDGDIISVTKSGRRNRYRIHDKESLRHDLEANCTVRDLMRTVNKNPRIVASIATAVTKVEESASSKPKKPNRTVESPSGNKAPADLVSTKLTELALKEHQQASLRPKKPKSDSPKKIKRKERQQGSLF
jgi:DNA-binding IscR family transcriptional regulator